MNTIIDICDHFGYWYDDSNYPNNFKRDLNDSQQIDVPTELEFSFMKQFGGDLNKNYYDVQRTRNLVMDHYPNFVELCDKIPNFWERF